MATWSAGVLTVSDACERGEREDTSGDRLVRMLADAGFEILRRQIVPDERDQISATLRAWATEGCALIVTTGGTGLAPRDVTPEATTDVLDRTAPGISEMLRAAGLAKTPRAALSRGVAGTRERTLIVNLPGSPRAVAEGVEALLPILEHAIAICRGAPVDH